LSLFTFSLIVLYTLSIILSFSKLSPYPYHYQCTLPIPLSIYTPSPHPFYPLALSPYPIILHTLPITLSFSIRSSYRYHPPPQSPPTLIISTRSTYSYHSPRSPHTYVHSLQIPLATSALSPYPYHPPCSPYLSHNYLPITYHLSYLRIQFLPHSHPPYHQQSSRYYPQPCHILKNTPYGLIFSMV